MWGSLWIVGIWSVLSASIPYRYYVLRMWLCSKRPVNVQITFIGRLVIGCLLADGLGVWNECWVVWPNLLGGIWWWWSGNTVLVSGFYGYCDELSLILVFSNFIRRSLLAFCCCYTPLLSWFGVCLKWVVIKNPCKTEVLWICWNYLWDRCWRLSGKCVRFGFFAADTATK